jgi:O-antigen/teichoic acid export membrane protein
MSNERRILVNTAVLSVSETASQLANFVLVIAFARTFGAKTLGHYSVAMAVGAVAAVFVSFGTQGMLIREFGRDSTHAPATLGVLMPIQALLAVIAWLIACIITDALIRDTAATALVMAVCGYQILLCLASLLLVPLQAKELMHWSAGGNLAHRLLILLIGLAVIRFGGSAAGVGLSQIVGALCLIAFAWVQGSRRFGRPTLRYAPAQALTLFRRASPFFGVNALSVIYARGPLIMLSALALSRSVGLYAAADRFMVAASLASSMFNSAVYPTVVRVSHGSIRDATVLTARCVRILLVISFPIAILVTIYADNIVGLFFGASYLGAAKVLQVLVWSLPIRGAQGLLASLLAAMDQQAGLARLRAVGLCAFSVLAPVLILSFDYVGAACAVLLCDTLQFALYWSLLRKKHADPPLTKAVLAPGSAVALTAAVSGAIEHLHPPTRLIMVILVLTAGMFALGAVRPHDLRFLRALIMPKS